MKILAVATFLAISSFPCCTTLYVWRQGTQQHQFRINNLASLISTWDELTHEMRQRDGETDPLGCYLVQADMLLKRKGLADWPKDKLCFPWYTNVHVNGAIERRVNDVIFYVPKQCFQHFRSLLQQAPTEENFHWLNAKPEVRQQIWTMYNVTHASNPAKQGNPLYEFASRPSALIDDGKFRHEDLQKEYNRHIKELAEK